MGEDVRRSRLDELKQELDQLQSQYAGMFDQVNALNGKLWVVNYQERQAKKYPNKKYSFWERMVTKRRDYRASQAVVRSLDSLREKKVVLIGQLELAEMQVAKKIKATGIEGKIATLEHEIKVLEQDLVRERSNTKLSICVIGSVCPEQTVNDLTSDLICNR